MKNPLSVLIERVPKTRRKRIEKVVSATAGTAAAIWMVLRLRRDLYGPGGSRLSRYNRAVDKVWRRD
ncbi:MAG: hypothetical protein ABIS03_05005 [Gemmatimonadaceae bacterium]